MTVPTRTLPSGDELPVVGAGTWRLHGDDLAASVEAALDAGYRHFDTAEGYGNEADLGDALAEGLASRGLDREDVFLTSKVLPKHLDYESTIAACEASLERLGVDALDLYLIHWPNPAISLRETLSALGTLRDRGLVRNVGVSNFTAYQLSVAHHIAPFPIAVNQVEIHPWYQQRDLREYAADTETVLEAAAPLGRTEVLGDETVRAIAEEYGKTPAQVVLRWTVSTDVVVLPKSSSPAHVRENIDLFGWDLDESAHRRLDELARDRPVYDTPTRDWTDDTYGIAE